MRALIRMSGFVLVLGAVYPFWEALRALSHREYVAAGIASAVGWFLTQAGVEFLRPESAE
jgi:hypothetical protein